DAVPVANTGDAVGVLIAAVAGGDARSFELAREDLDHAADRIRTPVARARTAHDLDALDRVDRQLFERERTGVDRRRTHAVDEHQRVIRICAAQGQRRLTTLTD